MLKALGTKLGLVKNQDADEHLELFFVSAVSSVLVIRFFLAITGYPQISPGDLHVAHMLWGGLLMMFAMMLVLSYTNRWVGMAASIMGGIGFGTFIDELGKFITKDNDYFFRPTVAILYVIFVGLFFLFRTIGRNPSQERPFSLEVLNRFFRSTKVQKISLIVFVAYSIIAVVSSAFGIWSMREMFLINSHLSALAAAGIDTGSSLVSAFIVIVGVTQFRKHRVFSLKLFKIALLISLAVSQVFSFYNVQFWALSDLIVTLVILGVVQQLLSEQEQKKP